MTTFADDADWDDPVFLSQVDAAEAEVVRRISQVDSSPAVKRQRTSSEAVQDSATSEQAEGTEPEGDYTAALKGSKSARWEANDRGPGHNHAHGYAGGGGGNGEPGSVPERSCPCGAGPCTVLTAHTERNMGRRFYRCPRGKEEGCSFFDWCDSGSTGGSQFMAQTVQSGPSSFSGRGSYSDQATSQPPVDCPCGAGPCPALTAKTKQNMGRMFYRCPNTQRSCGFFKWCDEFTRNSGNDSGSWPKSLPNRSVGPSGYQSGYQSPSAAAYGGYASQGNVGGPANTGNCFTCGQTGHWSKDCPSTASFGGQDKGGKTGTPCFTCGQPGHWASNCPNTNSPQKKGGWAASPPSSRTTASSGGQDKGVRSNDTCFKCGKQGHWALNCPNSNSPQKQPSWSNSVQNSGNPGTYGGSGKSGECHKCRQPGHWASDCTSNNVPQAGQWSKPNFNPSNRNAGTFCAQGGRGGGTGNCFKCGQPGHWASNCPVQISPQKASSGRGTGYYRGGTASGCSRR